MESNGVLYPNEDVWLPTVFVSPPILSHPGTPVYAEVLCGIGWGCSGAPEWSRHLLVGPEWQGSELAAEQGRQGPFPNQANQIQIS
jgi:hypothetical protein